MPGTMEAITIQPITIITMMSLVSSQRSSLSISFVLVLVIFGVVARDVKFAKKWNISD
jgi:hypothetical protein